MVERDPKSKGLQEDSGLIDLRALVASARMPVAPRTPGEHGEDAASGIMRALGPEELESEDDAPASTARPLTARTAPPETLAPRVVSVSTRSRSGPPPWVAMVVLGTGVLSLGVSFTLLFTRKAPVAAASAPGALGPPELTLLPARGNTPAPGAAEPAAQPGAPVAAQEAPAEEAPVAEVLPREAAPSVPAPAMPAAGVSATETLPASPAAKDPTRTPTPVMAARAAEPAALRPSPAPAKAATKASAREASSMPEAPAEPPSALGAAMQAAVAAPAAAPRAGAAAAAMTPGLPERPSQGAVTSALSQALPRARACLGPDAGILRALVAFGPSGKVASVTFSSGGDRTEAPCVATALKAAEVGPFAGEPYKAQVTVRPPG